MSLRESGNVAATHLLHEAAETTLTRAAKLSMAWKKEKTAREKKWVFSARKYGTSVEVFL
jgi:hypothetical protein